jgi:RNA polymerase sigma-70 factor (ECF subfamily)
MSGPPTFNEDDQVKLGALFEEHRSHLDNVLKRYIWNHHRREDYLSDIFVRVLQKWHQYNRLRPFWPWLLQLAVNYLRTQMRNPRRRSDFSLVEDLDSLINADAEACDEPPLEAMIRSEDNQRIRERVEGMPEHLRVTVTLRYWESRSGPEIADILNVPVGTVYRRLHEAHQMLKGL